MAIDTGINISELLFLGNNIRISSSNSFNAQDAYDNTFEDLLTEENSKTQCEIENKNKINFSNLGAPAGFFLDTSLLDEVNG